MSLRAYVLRRVSLLVFVIAGILIATFIIVRVIPSNPAELYLGSAHARPEQIAAASHKLGLDRPLIVQLGIYGRDFITGNWGDSLRTHRPVLREILHFLPSSLELIIVAMFIATTVGIALGAVTADKKGKRVDHAGRLFAIGGVSLPSFFLALLLQLIFFRMLHLLPVSGPIDIAVSENHPVTTVTGMLALDALLTGNFAAFFNTMEHLILPALALAAYPMGVITRMTRSAMLESMESDYVRMASAMGVPQRLIVFRFALKNALPPVLTIMGLLFAYSLVGTFFVEMIFAWPGLGTYTTLAILSLDYPAIMGITVLVALVYVTINLVIDLVIAWIDPRVVLS